MASTRNIISTSGRFLQGTSSVALALYQGMVFKFVLVQLDKPDLVSACVIGWNILKRKQNGTYLHMQCMAGDAEI